MRFLENLEKTANTQPFTVAIATENTVVNYKTLNDTVQQYVNFFDNTGIKSSDVTALCIRNPVTHFTSSLALLRMGCTQLSIPSDATLSQIKKSLALCKSNLLLCDKPKQLSGIKQVSVKPETIANLTPEYKNYTPTPDGCALLILGSGTTGKQKLIPVTFKNLASLVERDLCTQGIEAFDRHLCLSPIPFFTTKRRMYACLLASATAVFRENFKTPLIPLCQSLAVDHLSLVIPHAHNLITQIQNRSFEVHRLPRLKSLFIGSAPVSEQLRKDLKTFITPNVYVFYGPNEFGPACYADPDTQSTHPETIGRACHQVEIEIVDDKDQPCQANEVGHMRLRTEGMFEGYQDNQAASEKALRDGWYYPDDLACMDENGVITFKGRSDDLIIFNGINIYPREIEHTLEQHPAIKEVAAFPIENEGGEQFPGCALTLNHKVEASVLEDYCMQHLGVIRPRFIDIYQKLPKNNAGKILKKELRKSAQKKHL